MIKLNIGCGNDYRNGFVNIDSSSSLAQVDKIIRFPSESLLNHFNQESCDFILAQDVVEHLFRWEALELIKDFSSLLIRGGGLEIRVPDTEYIISSWKISLKKKIVLLYGGQDLPQGGPSNMEISRKEHPELFCHKYGWTREGLSAVLRSFGFDILVSCRVGTNIVIKAQKH